MTQLWHKYYTNITQILHKHYTDITPILQYLSGIVIYTHTTHPTVQIQWRRVTSTLTCWSSPGGAGFNTPSRLIHVSSNCCLLVQPAAQTGIVVVLHPSNAQGHITHRVCTDLWLVRTLGDIIVLPLWDLIWLLEFYVLVTCKVRMDTDLWRCALMGTLHGNMVSPLGDHVARDRLESFF